MPLVTDEDSLLRWREEVLQRFYQFRELPAHVAPKDIVLIVVLTGYASIATAVEAIKLGACHYLAKPANTDDIEAAFARAQGDAEVEVTERATTSIKTLEWERIHETLAATGFPS